jgi:predicted aldo/keto reductase-like oxidoreductase
MFKRFNLEMYKSLTGASMEKARTCLECGECMPRCPYHLEIPKLIRENLSLWEKRIR